MIVSNIEIVTVLVILLFLIPVLWHVFKEKFFERISFVGLIKIFNKSLLIQGILALLIIPLSWIWNKSDFIFDSIIAETGYTYIVVGIFMYLPSLAFLNFVKLIIEARIKRS